MVHGAGTEPRDVDVVVDGASIEDLTKLFQDVVVRRTRFGGLHLNVRGWMVDVWPLSDTWALRELGVGSRDFQALTRTTFLNVEAVVIDLTNHRRMGRQIYSSGFFEAIRGRALDINLEENPFPELCAIRALVTASKLRYGLSKRLASYVAHHVGTAPLRVFCSRPAQPLRPGQARCGNASRLAEDHSRADEHSSRNSCSLRANSTSALEGPTRSS